jgi:hypothetical protein
VIKRSGDGTDQRAAQHGRRRAARPDALLTVLDGVASASSPSAPFHRTGVLIAIFAVFVAPRLERRFGTSGSEPPSALR